MTDKDSKDSTKAVLNPQAKPFTPAPAPFPHREVSLSPQMPAAVPKGPPPTYNGNPAAHGTLNASFSQLPPPPPLPQPGQSDVAKLSCVFPHRVALLMLGGKGSGKSTQCEAVAKACGLLHVGNTASGSPTTSSSAAGAAADGTTPLTNHSIASAGDDGHGGASGTSGHHRRAPLLDLESTLQEHFGPSAANPQQYKGVVVDQLFTTHEFESFYILEILQRFGFRVDMAFLLKLDDDVAARRAKDAGVTGAPQGRSTAGLNPHIRRMLDHRMQYAAVMTVFNPLVTMHCVNCNGMPEAAVTRGILRAIDAHFSPQAPPAAPRRTPDLPHLPHTQGHAKLVADYRLFAKVRHDALCAVHGTERPPVACPLTQPGGIVDAALFSTHRRAQAVIGSYAALRSDGIRTLVVRHEEGVYAFTPTFAFMYDLGPLLAEYGVVLPPRDAAATGPVDLVLDCDCASVAVNGLPLPQLTVNDVVLAGALRGVEALFPARLAALTSLFAAATVDPARPVLIPREYVEAKHLREQLADYWAPPRPLDGVQFQHKGVYHIGRDPALFVWRPREHFLIELRLDQAQEPAGPGAPWRFQPLVLEDGDEVPWPQMVVFATDADARRHDLCDGCIVDVIRREAAGTPSAPPSPAAGAALPPQKKNGAGSSPLALPATPPTAAGAPPPLPGAAAKLPPPPPPPIAFDFVRKRPDRLAPARRDVVDHTLTMQHVTYADLLRLLGCGPPQKH